MDLNANPAAVFGFDVAGAPFDCVQFLGSSSAGGATIAGVFTALDVPVLGTLELDIVSSISMTGQ